MAALIDGFNKAWNALAADSSDPGWRSIFVAKIGRSEAHAARRFPENAEAVLVDFHNAKYPRGDKLPVGAGFLLEIIDPNRDGRTWIALTRRDGARSDIFSAMVLDLADLLAASKSETDDQSLRGFIRRVVAWQEFMGRGSSALSPEAELGLVGELAFLKLLLGEGLAPANALEAWVGPVNGVQDFWLGSGAVEVKSTVAISGFVAKIGSLDQLDDSLRHPMFLACARFSLGETGKTLPELCQSVSESLDTSAESRLVFQERLLGAGYISAHATAYSRRFRLEALNYIKVEETFPRLTSANVPRAIKRATYEIDLDPPAQGLSSPKHVLSQLGVTH